MNVNIVFIFQIAVSLFLIGVILVQSRGKGLGRAWGFSGSSFTRRGLEKLIFKATFVLTALFIVVSVLQFFV